MHLLGPAFSGGINSFTSGMEVCCIASLQSLRLISTLTPLVPTVRAECGPPCHSFRYSGHHLGTR